MSDNDTTRPEAEFPTSLALTWRAVDGVCHTKGQASLQPTCSEYVATAWVDPDADAELVAELVELAQQAGYAIKSVHRTDTTERVAIKAEA